MPIKILIMGLSTSGKTTLARRLVFLIEQSGKSVEWFNADIVRNVHQDWDFSEVGRIRQANRMANMANQSMKDYVVVDFIAPLQKMRDIFNPDYTVWVNTIKESKHQDTDKIFELPKNANCIVDTKNSELWADIIFHNLLSKY
jgi:adenylylsulfate kinase